MLLKWTSVPFFGEIVSRYGVQRDPHTMHMFTEMPILNLKKEVNNLF